MKITKEYDSAWENIFEEHIVGTIHITLKDDTLITAYLDGENVWGDDYNDIYLDNVTFVSKITDISYPVSMYIACDQIQSIIFASDCKSDTDRGLIDG